MKFILRILALILMVNTNASAQNKEDENYSKASAEMRQQVWDNYKEEFTVMPIPAAYLKYSKVVLARHTELIADSRTKIKFSFWGATSNRALAITEVAREMIKLNDKNAVSEYSELSYTQFEKTSGFSYDEKTTTYVGVRIIKPNGKVKEINADEVVLTRNESRQKKAKLAISDLEPGDIIDYFIATEQQLINDFDAKPYDLILFDDAPILKFSFHSQLGKKYNVLYRSYNGAPILKVEKNEDKEIIIDLKKENIPAFETSLWVAPARQLPFIRLNISLGGNPYAAKNSLKKTGMVTEIKDAGMVIEQQNEFLSARYFYGYILPEAKNEYNSIEKDAKLRAKKLGLNFNNMSSQDKAAFLFYTLRFTKLLNFEIDKLARTISTGNYYFEGLGQVLFFMMQTADINSAMVLSTDHTNYRMTDIMVKEDLAVTAYLPEINKYLSIQSVYDVPFATPREVDGQTDTKMVKARLRGKLSDYFDMENGKKVPMSAADSNAHIDKIKLSLASDNSNLEVERTTTLKGYYKRGTQANLILYEDYYEAERLALGNEKSLIEMLGDNKKGKKYVDEVKSAFADARKDQKEAFITEASDWFEQAITQIKDQKIVNLGVRHTAPHFIYSSSFKLDGLVKKAGNNFIIDIGKIQGKPLVIKEEQRKREIDVYMPYARSIAYDIELAIPEGYSAEGVTALNKTVTNESGSFTATATATDKLVTIHLKKSYHHNFEPAKNWNNIIAFTDAANEWTNAKILFKKK